MKRKAQSLYVIASLRGIFYLLLLCYFGFFVNPEWAPAPILFFPFYFFKSPPYFHWYDPFPPLFRVWLITLPIFLLVLAMLGFWGVNGLSSTKEKKMLATSTYKFFADVSGFGCLSFICSVILSMGTLYIYNHQTFDAEIWQNQRSTDSVPYQHTLRQRMVDDLTENILPGSTLDEIGALLGPGWLATETDKDSKTPDLIYYLGPDRMRTPFSEELVIWFDELGDFEKYEIAAGDMIYKMGRADQ